MSMSSSTAAPKGIELQAQDITNFKAILASCTTFHFYYIVSHFDEEVEYIWSKKWTAGKVMYLLTRYLGALFLLYASVAALQTAWDRPLISEKFSSGFFKTCLNGGLFVGLGTMIMLTAEVILQMRAYALYGRKKKMLAFFILLTLAVFGFNILQLTSIPLDAGTSICIGSSCNDRKRNLAQRSDVSLVFDTKACTVAAEPMSGIGWLVTSFVELLLFLLVIRKALQVKKDNKIQFPSFSPRNDIPRTHDIITLMARDSMAYFAAIFTICLIGTILAFGTQVNIGTANENIYLVRNFIKSLLNAYQTLVITIMTILAPKLLISLRMEYYGPFGLLTEKTQLSWNAEAPGRSDDHLGIPMILTCKRPSRSHLIKHSGDER